jgi:very-short-patch-repair endonuclease
VAPEPLAAPERVAARLASVQQGAVKHRQLVEEGVSPAVIKRLLRTGVLHPRHRGVYIVGHLALARFANEAAALLACGEHALISHRSAAHLWGLDGPSPRVDVTLIGRRRRPKLDVNLHHVATIERREVRRRHRMRVTSPARTLIDLAAELSGRELERLLAEARVRGLVREGELELALEQAGRRRGSGRLRALLRAEGAPGITRSRGERRLRRLLHEAQLPQPRPNVKEGDWEIDFLWSQQRVALELDGLPFHNHARAIERDRRKDMALHDAGYHVIRVSGKQLKNEPLAVIAHVARALDRRARPAG